jgi:hypothetical protein
MKWMLRALAAASAACVVKFHPLNAASPYQDNACTATRAIGGASGESRLPEGTSPVASGLTSGRWHIPLWTGAAAVVLAAGAILLIRRRRSP